MKYKRFKKAKYRYNQYNSNELLKIHNLSILYLFLNNNLKILFLHKMFNTNKLILKKSLKYYCSVSGRTKSIYAKFNISRIKLRDLSPLKLFTGLKKIS